METDRSPTGGTGVWEAWHLCHGTTTTEVGAGAGGDDGAVTVNWTTTQALLVLLLGLLFALGGTWVAADRSGRVAHLAAWDRRRWQRQRVKTGMHPSPFAYRLTGGGTLISAGCVLVASALDRLTVAATHGLLASVEAVGVLGFASSLIIAWIAASGARQRGGLR